VRYGVLFVKVLRFAYFEGAKKETTNWSKVGDALDWDST
jgi:hypothetical protein